MTPRHTAAIRGGVTYSETAVVLAILATLIAILVPVVLSARENSRRTHDGDNLRQILGATVAYGQEEQCSWPLGVSPSCTLPAKDAHQARLVTARSLEVLACHFTLSNSLFTASNSTVDGPVLKPRCDDGNGDAWGASTTHAVGVAFDWSAPGISSSLRAILACRSPAGSRGFGTMVAFGDGHAKWVMAGSGTGIGMMTEDNLGKPVTKVTNSRVIGADDNSDKNLPDNIYDNYGDTGFIDEDVLTDPLAPEKGSPLRAWVK